MKVVLVRVNAQDAELNNQEIELTKEQAEKILIRQSAKRVKKCWDLKEPDKYKLVNGKLNSIGNSKSNKAAKE